MRRKVNLDVEHKSLLMYEEFQGLDEVNKGSAVASPFGVQSL